MGRFCGLVEKVVEEVASIPIHQIKMKYKVNLMKSRLDFLYKKLKLDEAFYEEKYGSCDEYIYSNEFKNKVNFVLCEYLLLSIDEVKFEQFYILFQNLYSNPEIEIAFLQEYLDLVKALTNQDFKNLITLLDKKNNAVTYSSNFPTHNFQFSKMFKDKSAYQSLDTKDSSKLLRYGLIKQNFGELTTFIMNINENKYKSSLEKQLNRYNPKYMISDYGEVFITMFKDIYNDNITKKEKKQ